jgi:hypothetical protein
MERNHLRCFSVGEVLELWQGTDELGFGRRQVVDTTTCPLMRQLAPWKLIQDDIRNVFRNNL